MAADSIELEQVAELVEGAAEVCRAAGCLLLGGETAELPGIYREDELDFAGTCVGVVDRERLIDGTRVEAGDLVLGFPSAGLHANGFTLVRGILEHDDYDGDDLLAPTRLYLDEVRALQARADVRALAHVTGGGIAGNLARVVPERARSKDRLGLLGAAAGLRLAGRARRGGGAATRLQPRDRLLRGGARRRRGRGARDRTDRVIGVLVSGEGTNLQALLDAALPVVAVASNRADARALQRAAEAGVATGVFELDSYSDREARDAAMAAWLEQQGVDLVVCAGYMHLLRPSFLDRFAGRIVNTHSAPLPEFPGAHPIEDVLAAGVPETAATVHYVDEGVDTGAVIRAERIPVREDDTADSLRARVQAVEHSLLPSVVRELIAR